MADQIRYFVEPNEAHPDMLVRIRPPDVADVLIPSRGTWERHLSVMRMIWDPEGIEIDAAKADAIAKEWGSTRSAQVEHRAKTEPKPDPDKFTWKEGDITITPPPAKKRSQTVVLPGGREVREDWDPADHPRGPGGHFGDSGGTKEELPTTARLRNWGQEAAPPS